MRQQALQHGRREAERRPDQQISARKGIDMGRGAVTLRAFANHAGIEKKRRRRRRAASCPPSSPPTWRTAAPDAEVPRVGHHPGGRAGHGAIHVARHRHDPRPTKRDRDHQRAADQPAVAEQQGFERMRRRLSGIGIVGRAFSARRRACSSGSAPCARASRPVQVRIGPVALDFPLKTSLSVNSNPVGMVTRT